MCQDEVCAMLQCQVITGQSLHTNQKIRPLLLLLYETPPLLLSIILWHTFSTEALVV